MAIAIKSIPTLREKAAKQFTDRVNETSQKRSTINFSKQAKSADVILKKANLK
tara:strand:+ start:1768 stop:1926 length:159 start_codon:yes stop_codon:yes gene_type:complete